MTVSSMVEGVASSMATITNSYIHTGANITSAGNGPNSGSRMSFNSDVYYNFLEEYHFVSAIINIFSSVVVETLDKVEFKVEILEDPDSPVTQKCNEFLKFSNFKGYVITHLHEMLYRGSFSFGLDFVKLKALDLKSPYNADIVYKEGELIGSRIGSKFVPSTKIATYYFQAGTQQPLVKEDAKDSDMLEDMKLQDKKIKQDKNSLDSLIVKYSKFKGQSIFLNQLDRMFQMKVLEHALYFLGLRDTLRPEIIGFSTGGRQVNVAQSLNMANSIEGLLNKSTNGISSVVDPNAFMNNLSFQILNYVKVVPSVDQYQGITDIAAGDLAVKREKLMLEKERTQRDILNDLTIPEELFSGSSNRWETMSRNDRFMTTIDTMLKSVARLVKDVCIACCKVNFDKEIKSTEIQFNLDCTSMLSAYDIKSKMANVGDKFNDIERIIQSATNLNASEFIKKEELLAYIRAQLATIDDKLLKVIVNRAPEQLQMDPSMMG